MSDEISTGVLLGVWLSTALSVFIYSFLFKDNPLFKLAEHIFVGVSVGYLLTITYHEIMLKKLYVPLVEQGHWLLWIAALLGLLMLARLIPHLAWLSRIAFAFILGMSSGVAIPRFLSSFVLKQVQGTLKPLASVSPLDGGIAFTSTELNALLILIGVVSVLFYFFFSIEQTKVTRPVARIGIYFLMVSFGAAFGYTVMARMSLLIGRFDELLVYASPRYGYATLIILIGVVTLFLWWEQKPRGAV